jgi:hypothetical protein
VETLQSISTSSRFVCECRHRRFQRRSRQQQEHRAPSEPSRCVQSTRNNKHLPLWLALAPHITCTRFFTDLTLGLALVWCRGPCTPGLSMALGGLGPCQQSCASLPGEAPTIPQPHSLARLNPFLPESSSTDSVFAQHGFCANAGSGPLGMPSPCRACASSADTLLRRISRDSNVSQLNFG